jgi:hypothetical protein
MGNFLVLPLLHSVIASVCYTEDARKQRFQSIRNSEGEITGNWRKIYDEKLQTCQQNTFPTIQLQLTLNRVMKWRMR